MRLLLLLLCWIVLSPLWAQNFKITPLLSDHSLSDPWEILYGPDDNLWVTQRSAKSIVRIDPQTGSRDFLVAIHEAYQASTQDGLLGMALHPDWGGDEDFVYVSYTYFEGHRKQKLVRFTFGENAQDGTLSDPTDILVDLPASNDHNSGRLHVGPDHKLYYSIGDQGKNQYENVCEEIMAQSLPSQQEIDNQDWRSYQGKILRINLDGSIPEDNPIINGVQSHVYSYGHRNPQGLVFTQEGSLYSAEHGPKTDDELNLILPGKNYGWPYVAGHQDDQAYTYCNWSSSNNCGNYSDFSCPSDAEQTLESDWYHADFIPPLKTYYTVDNSFDFENTNCDVNFICWPTIAPSSLDIYDIEEGIPEWHNSLLIVSLKLGRVFKQDLDALGLPVGEATPYWDSQNRYRDIALHPNGREFYIITDNKGQTSGPSSSNTNELKNPGNILHIKYNDNTLSADQKINDDHLFSIYPNPTQNTARLVFNNQSEAITKNIRIINLQGQIIHQQSKVYEHYSTPPLDPGVYIIHVSHSQDLIESKKLVVR